jgi:lipoprotein-releasing system permease protein
MVPEMKKGNQFVTARVAGTFESGLYDYDSQFALMNINDTQKIFETGSIVATGIEIKLVDPVMADAVAYRINSDLPASYQAITWGELNRDLFEALSLERLVFSIIMGTLVIVAAFNIIGVLVLLICYRAHEVAILKALGLRRRTLEKIFARGGFSTGVIGTLIGLIAGLGICFALKHYHFIRLAPEVYFLKTLPIDISWAICGIIGLFSVLMCWGTSRIAARRLADLPISENL